MTICYGSGSGLHSVFANSTGSGLGNLVTGAVTVTGGGGGGTYTTTSTATTSNPIWQVWAGQQALEAQTQITQIWNSWGQYPLPPPVQTVWSIQQEAQRQADIEAARQRVLRQQTDAERLAKAQAAYNRATGLLEDHLTPRQLDTFRRLKWFAVQGGKSKKQYAILTHGPIAGNVRELKDRRAVKTFCCHGSYDIPAPDQWLTQKLWLQYDEAGFLRIANASSLAPSDYLYDEAA